MTLKELLARQQQIVDLARKEKRDLTAEESGEFDRLQEQIEELKKQQPSDAQRAVEEERRRTASINAICRDFGIDSTEFLENGSSVDEVRAKILEKLKKDRTPSSVKVTACEADKFRSAATDALLMKSGSIIQNPAEGAKELRNCSIKDIAAECLEHEGINSKRMSADELFDYAQRSFYNPTAVFPAILDNTINKKIVEAYSHTPTTFEAWTSKGTLSDFKENKDAEYIIGAGEFYEVPENGELKADTILSEKLPTRQLKTYGRQFTMTRQAFINDDIGLITKMPALYARKAKITIDRQVYRVLFDNKKIFDGKNLFDTAHNNDISSGAMPSVEAIEAMILKMRAQKDAFGEAINVVPAFIVVPVGYEFALNVIFGSTNLPGSQNNDKNPLYNSPISVVQTPVLNEYAGTNNVPWYLVADINTAKSIQIDYLNGNEMPTISRNNDPNILGFSWNIFLDWGISVVDYRGITRNAGAKITI